MPANILIRFKAFMWDYVLIFSYMILLFILSVFIFPSIQLLFAGSPVSAQFYGFLIITFPVSLYFIVSDSKLGRQSFGKRKTRIRVVDGNGESVSVARMTGRTILMFLPWELSHYLVYRLINVEGDVPMVYAAIGWTIYALIFVYILTAIFTKERRALYDLIMNTKVVKVEG